MSAGRRAGHYHAATATNAPTPHTPDMPRPPLAAALATAAALFACTARAAAPACDTDPALKLGGIAARVILVGETHGTEQGPAFVARLVCGLLAQGRPVTLALERSAAEQPALDAYLASAGTAADQRAVLASGDWASDHQDGRSSAAMLKLLGDVRRLRQAGQAVDVTAMVPTLATDSQAEFDRLMAAHVGAVLARQPTHTVVVYAGTFHTAVASRMHQDIVGAPSVGDLLAAAQPVHVIGLRSGAGEGWFCTQACGTHAMLAAPWDLPDARVDTVVELGPVTPSGPGRLALQASP